MAKASADAIAKQVNIPSDKVQEWISQASKSKGGKKNSKTPNKSAAQGNAQDQGDSKAAPETGTGDSNQAQGDEQAQGGEKKEKTSFMVKKAIEKGKQMVNKQVGGPEGVEKFVNANQKKIDERIGKAPDKLKQAWESIKKVAKAGTKKCVEFCKKHWKAIVIILIVVAIIAFLLYKFGGAGTEQVAGSETVQNSATEITNGANEIASGGNDLIDKAGNREWFNSIDGEKKELLGKMFKDDPEMIASNNMAGFDWGGDHGLMSSYGDNGFSVNMEGQIQLFDKMGNPVDGDGNILDIDKYMKKLASSDPRHGVLKAKLFANACHAMKHALKIGAAQALP